MKLTIQIAQDLLMIAQAGEDGWRLVSVYDDIDANIAGHAARPMKQHENVLDLVNRADGIGIKAWPDSLWRSLNEGEKPQGGDWFRIPDPKGSRKNAPEPFDWRRVPEGAAFQKFYEYRTFRPKS